MKDQALLNESIVIGTRRRVEVSLRNALAIVVAYMWQTVNGGPVSASNAYKFAAHSYDFVLRGYPNRIVAGLYASTGLNSDLGAVEMLRVLAAVNEGLIPELSDDLAFWEMDVEKLVTDPNDDSPEGKLWSFFKAFMGDKVDGVKTGGINGVGAAGYSKTAHHGWPRQMPLFDSIVLRAWSSNGAWREMHETLTSNSEWFAELERLIEVYRIEYQSGDGFETFRLRHLDVLAWINGSGQWDSALAAGEALLDACGDISAW